MSVNETSSRRIWVKLDSIEPHFWSAFYLDAYEKQRSFFLEPKSFTKPLKVKSNAVSLLSQKLSHIQHHLRDIVSIGFKGEPYGEEELHYKLTQGLLEKLLAYRYPVHLVSGSDMILRDIELLKEIADSSFLHISVPVVLQHELYDRFYPKESLEASLSLIKTLRKVLPKVHISAIVLPILPLIGDDQVTIEKMVQTLKGVGTQSLSFTLYEEMPFKQIQILLDTLQDIPEYIELYKNKFSLDVEAGVLVKGEVEVKAKDKEVFSNQVASLSAKYGLDMMKPRYIPEDFRHSNYVLAQRLFKRAHLYDKAGEDSSSVRKIAQYLQGLDYTVSKKELLEFAKNEKVKRDIDYFLFNNELKVLGQARLF